jgi:hypothetical protein
MKGWMLHYTHTAHFDRGDGRSLCGLVIKAGPGKFERRKCRNCDLLVRVATYEARRKYDEKYTGSV